MPSLRDYRDRIKSVKSTKKITSAMKMVAASKLRKTQEQAQNGHPYAQAMAGMLGRLASHVDQDAQDVPMLLKGTGRDQKHLLIVVTADRGLCGGFNANIVKAARTEIAALEGDGKEVSIICIGRRGYDLLVREHGNKIIHVFREIFGKDNIEFSKADSIAQFVLSRFDLSEFDVCSLMFNKFVSVLVQEPHKMQLIPFQPDNESGGAAAAGAGAGDGEAGASAQSELRFPYSYEPSEEVILSRLLPRNVGVQIFSGLLDSAAGEQAARMTAMDNATRNASDMIDDLTLQYNRARQAHITKELIEIISGAETV